MKCSNSQLKRGKIFEIQHSLQVSFIARWLKPSTWNMKTNVSCRLRECPIIRLLLEVWGDLEAEKGTKNYAIITISSFYIRSEKEALKKRKKRTPTVAMTTEQYKAKRGILNSTPKKTGKSWNHIFLQMVVCILLSHSKMHVCVLIFTFQGTDCMRSQ